MFVSSGISSRPTPDRRDRRVSNRPSYSFLAVVLMLAMAPAMARQDVPLTLAEAEDLALRAEPGQQSMQARAAALEERAIAAGELPDPMLRVGLNNFPIESGGFSTEGMTNLGVGLRQSFPSGKTLELSERRFAEMATEMHQSADARGRSVLNATRTAWYDLYYWRQAEALVAASRPFFDELAAISEAHIAASG